MSMSPLNGSLTAQPIGAMNSSIFECDVYDDFQGEPVQIGTTWTLQPSSSNSDILILQSTFEGILHLGGTARPLGSPLGGTFMNRLTVVNFTEDLDGAVLSCGAGDQILGHFNLRVYREFIEFIAIAVALEGGGAPGAGAPP